MLVVHKPSEKDLYGEVDWSIAYVSIFLHYEAISLELSNRNNGALVTF